LYAFAALGYRYAMREVLQPFRDQIMRPAEKVVQGATGRIAPAIERGITFIREPAELQGVLVSLGDRLIFLPGISDDARTFYDRFARRDERGQITMRGPSYSLPKRPLFLFDLNEGFLRRTILEVSNG
jgi:hypothetical protein